ncbi:MAG: NAD-dependent epimerase/dehydratase family protein [Candidatus Micrarchaeia archaeon]
MANKVFMSGAGGRLGRAVFQRTGAVPLVRRPSGLSGEIVTDFSAGQLKGILKDARIFIHAAGSVDTLDKKGLWESNLALTRRIVAALPKGCRLIFASSISVYGKLLAEVPADEGTPVNPDSEYARSKYESERAVSALPDHVILRIGTIYGPEFQDYFRIFRRLEQGRMKIIGDGQNRIPFVHVEDVAEAFRNALERGSGVYVIAGDPLTQKRIYEIASRELGVDPPSGTVERRSAVLLAAFGEILHRFGGKRPPLTREHVAVLAYDRAFDCSKARKELGFSPRPLEKGIREMVSDYKRN